MRNAIAISQGRYRCQGTSIWSELQIRKGHGATVHREAFLQHFLLHDSGWQTHSIVEPQGTVRVYDVRGNYEASSSSAAAASLRWGQWLNSRHDWRPVAQLLLLLLLYPTHPLVGSLPAHRLFEE